jgi:glycosyltransferase involved in cell wall biosynthesis
MIHSKESITAFFPAYNNEHSIEDIVCSAWEELAKFTSEFEVVVVNDGSCDGTGRILDRLQRELPFVRVIHHKESRGYGAALITGFQNATKDLIFYTDGDGRYDVREVHNLMAQLGPEVDQVSGYKVRSADPWPRAWICEIYRRTMTRAFNLSIRGVDCDFRLFRRSVLDSVKLRSKSGLICVEIRPGRICHCGSSGEPLSASARHQQPFPPPPCCQETGESFWCLVGTCCLSRSVPTQEGGPEYRQSADG